MTIIYCIYTGPSQARNKRDIGEIEEAKGYTVAAIICNVLTILLVGGTAVGVGIYYGIVISNAQRNYDPY